MQNKIEQYFSSTTLLTKLCGQNGWMDEDSLRITLLEKTRDARVYEVRFEEILKQGSGCECDRNACWGKNQQPSSKLTGMYKGRLKTSPQGAGN